MALLALLPVLGLSLSATAQTLVRPGPSVNALEVKIGHTRLLDMPANIKRVSVGKEEICDVVVISPRQLYLVGREVGSTTLTMWDQQDRVLGLYEVRVARDLSRLKEHLHQILPNEPIEVREMEGTVLLSGRVSSHEAKTQAEALAKAAMPRKDLYDTLHAGEDTKQWVTSVIEVGGNQQINIKVRFAEVKRDVTKRMKANIGAINPLTGDFFFTMLDNLFTPSWDSSGTYSATYSTKNTMIGGFNIGGGKIRAALDILKENKMAKILAEPTLVAVSGQQAEFLAGGEFPVPVPQKDTITIEFKKFGVNLAFKPEVLKNGRVRMTVTPEVSEMDFS
ncbi:MAG: hypothetical protein C0405_13560, partial [Desulfovibrio sp.]|nr:hypothetical protein [Desulfovibrio sp.]